MKTFPRQQPGRETIRSPHSALRSPHAALGSGFTLLELLTVIAIIGILAAIILPSLRAYRPNTAAIAARQLLDDVGRARQLAISQRTTVYMIFVPTNFWGDPAFSAVSGSPTEFPKAQHLFDKQLVGYTFVSLRGVGDQPGRSQPRYWTGWRTLPAGAYIPFEKFLNRTALPNLTISTNSGGAPTLAFGIRGFSRTRAIPFPSEFALPDNNGNFVELPYIAFDDRGQVISGENEQIPLTRGSVTFTRNPTNGIGASTVPILQENPAGTSTNAYNLVSIDWLTGRGRIEKAEVR